MTSPPSFLAELGSVNDSDVPRSEEQSKKEIDFDRIALLRCVRSPYESHEEGNEEEQVDRSEAFGFAGYEIIGKPDG